MNRLADAIPWNGFLGSLIVYKYRLRRGGWMGAGSRRPELATAGSEGARNKVAAGGGMDGCREQ